MAEESEDRKIKRAYANPREMLDGTLWGKVEEEEEGGERPTGRRGRGGL